nr:MGMT family protein [Methanohalophilus profundi]
MKYLAGEHVDFLKYEPDLTHLTKFQREVLEATRKIPYGQTRTYGQLAKDIGKIKASRSRPGAQQKPLSPGNTLPQGSC